MELLTRGNTEILIRLERWLCCLQVANFDAVREKFGGSAAMLTLHDKIADVLLTATALSAESPGAKAAWIRQCWSKQMTASKCVTLHRRPL